MLASSAVPIHTFANFAEIQQHIQKNHPTEWSEIVVKGKTNVSRGVIKIQEIHGNNLIPKDFNGKSDPFLVFLTEDPEILANKKKRLMKTIFHF